MDVTDGTRRKKKQIFSSSAKREIIFKTQKFASLCFCVYVILFFFKKELPEEVTDNEKQENDDGDTERREFDEGDDEDGDTPEESEYKEGMVRSDREGK
jgi:hypothetical protein